jgi:hypothetical protein
LDISKKFLPSKENFSYDETFLLSYNNYLQTIIENLSTNHESVYRLLNSLSNKNEKILQKILDVLYTKEHPSKISQLFLSENPSQENLWVNLLNLSKSDPHLSNHIYIREMKEIINQFFSNVSEGKLTISEFIKIIKQSEMQRNSLVNLIQMTQSTNFEKISEIINDKCKSVENITYILENCEIFFSVFSTKINPFICEEFQKIIFNMRNNFEKVTLCNFIINEEIEKIQLDVILINKWRETQIYKNILDEEIINYLLKLNNEAKLLNKKAEVVNFMEFSEFLKICLYSIEKSKNSIFDLIKVENFNFSKITLKIISSLFKNLKDTEKEFTQICELNQLTSTEEKDNLKIILQNFSNISSNIKFSSLMIRLDSVFHFKQSNSNNNSNLQNYKNYLTYILQQETTTLAQIIEMNNNINILKSQINKKYDITNLLHELCENRDLLDFIISTPEEDFRNMVEAVDEHGDSFLRVQTIRDLLIIGSFLRILNLQNYQNNLTEEFFITTIHKALESNPTFLAIDALINSCSKHYISIKLLHKELSNREEASKNKVIEICRSSKVYIKESQSPKCRDILSIEVHFSQQNKKLNFRDLCDLRDRVLLLNNNNKNEKENFQNKENYFKIFINLVEISEKILLILNDLYENGYPEKFNTEFKITNGEISLYENFYDKITLINNQWKEDLKELYREFYALTYFKGNQFWEIENLFCKESKEVENSLSLSLDHSPGFFLLKYASAEITLNSIHKLKYSNLNSDTQIIKSPKERLTQLGTVLNQVIDIRKNGSRQIKQDPGHKFNLSIPSGKVIFTTPSNLKIYHHLLSIHFSYENALPSDNQILYCTNKTSLYELISFLCRYEFYPGHNLRLFTLIKVENLQFELQNFLIEHLNKNKTQMSSLCLICTDKNSFIYHQLKNTTTNNNFIHQIRDTEIMEESSLLKILKKLNLNVYVIRSDDTGAGKTHRIQKLCGYDRVKNTNISSYINLPILDSINIEKISHRLFDLNKIKTIKTIHMTINGIIDNYELLDHILFNYIFLGCLKFNDSVSFRSKDDPIFIEVANTFDDFLYNAITVLSLVNFQTEILHSKDSLKQLDINHSEKNHNTTLILYN